MWQPRVWKLIECLYWWNVKSQSLASILFINQSEDRISSRHLLLRLRWYRSSSWPSRTICSSFRSWRQLIGTKYFFLIECRKIYVDVNTGRGKQKIFCLDQTIKRDQIQDEDDYIPSQLLSSRPLEQSLSTSSGAKQRLSKISPRRLSLSLAGRKKLVVTMFIYDFSFPSLTISLPRKIFLYTP